MVYWLLLSSTQKGGEGTGKIGTLRRCFASHILAGGRFAGGALAHRYTDNALAVMGDMGSLVLRPVPARLRANWTAGAAFDRFGIQRWFTRPLWMTSAFTAQSKMFT
jgi:hypothetical protein